MDSLNQQELLLAIHNMELQLQQLKKLVQTNIPQSEWLSTQQFAELTGLKAKTVSNYAGKGRFQKVRKGNNKQWLIHISELNHFQ